MSRQMKITVSEEMDKILDTVLEENPQLTNRSMALRFLIFEQYKDYEQSKTKVRSIGRDVEVTLEIITSMAEQVKTTLKPRDDLAIYQDAKDAVERRVKRFSSNRKYR